MHARRWSLFLLSLIVLLSLAGCSCGEADSDTTTSDASDASTSETADEPVLQAIPEGDADTNASDTEVSEDSEQPVEDAFQYADEWDVPAEMWIGTWQIDNTDTVFPTVTFRADGTADLTRGRDGETRTGTWTLSGGEMTLEDSMGNIIINKVFFVAEGQWEMMFEGVYSKVE